MAENVAFAGLIFLTVFFLFLFTGMASYNAEIICPELSSASINSADVVTWVITNAQIFFSPCSGLPLWIYLLVFGPLGIAILVHVIPFVG